MLIPCGLRKRLVKSTGKTSGHCQPPLYILAPTEVSGPSLVLAYPISCLDLRGWPCGKWAALAAAETINKSFGVAKKPVVPM